MNKKRFISAMLAVLMIFVSIPLDTIKVQAGIGGSAGLVYSYDDTANTATVTGYSSSEAATVERIIIPEKVTNNNKEYTVTAISANALNSTSLPALKEVCVLPDNITIADKAFGTYSDGTVCTKVTVWCDPNSTADNYGMTTGLSRKYLNVKNLEINSPTSHYWTGCEPFEISTVIQAKSTDVKSSDIIWKTDNSELASFRDEDGNVLTETAGTLIDNEDGTTTVKVKVYVCDNETRKSGSVKITATCRGTGAAAEKTYSILKATTKIEPQISVYRPVMETDEQGNLKIKAVATDETKKNVNVVYEEVSLSELEENGYFINDTLYVDETYGYMIDGIVDEDSNDVCSGTYSVDDNTGLLIGSTLTNTTVSTGGVSVVGIINPEGESINETDILYAAKTSLTNSSVTLFSQNKVLSRKIQIKVCQPATDFQMLMGGAKVEDGRGYSHLVQTTAKLDVQFTPTTSTDTVTWTSSDPNVVKVQEGNNLYFNTPGTATITCKVDNARSGKRTLVKSFTAVSLAKVQYKEIVFAKDENRDSIITEKAMPIGSNYKLTVCDARNGEIYIAGNDETAANEPLTYTSSNLNVATVDKNGIITAATNATNTGTTKITVTAESGVSNSITVRVYAPADTINVPTALTVPEGQTLDFSYSLSPTTATEDVVWTSENKSIAVGEDYIDENENRFVRLTGVKTGTVTLVGKTVQSGTIVRVNVTVAPPVHADEVSMILTGEQVTTETDAEGNTVYNLPKGATMYLKPSLKSSTGSTTNDLSKWQVEAGQQACTTTVGSDGTLTIVGNKTGKIRVTLKAYGGSYEKNATCYINVYVPATAADIRFGGNTADEYKVEVGTTIQLTGALTPGDSTDSIAWSTDNDNVELSVLKSTNNSPVVMTAKTVGTTVIRIQADSGVVDTATVHVIRPAKSVTFVQDGQEVTNGYVTWHGKKTISLNVLEADTTDTTFTWGSVQDKGLIQITPNADGKSAVIEGLAPGTQQIRVTAPSGKSWTLNMNVVVPAESVQLNNTELSIYKGDPAVNVMAILSPSNTTDVVRWSVDKQDIITITEDIANSTSSQKAVKIQGIGVGTVNVTATTVDGLAATMKINVSAKDIGIVSVSSIAVQTYSGREITPAFTVMNENVSLRKDIDYTVTYSDNINAGQAKITIEGIGNYAGTKVVNFEIAPKNITQVQNAAVEPLTYTGSAQTPEILLTDSASGTVVTLVKGKDYTVEYTNNIAAGTGIAKFTGIGNYAGEKNVNFQITQKDMAVSEDITIAPISSKAYTGLAIMPDVVVKDGSVVLEKDKDYTISYTNNVNAGTATVNINGRGNYKNVKSAEFTINKRSLSKAKFSVIPAQIYTGKNITPGVSVQVGTRNLSLNTDYKISYSNNKKPGKATIKITGVGNYKSSASKTFVILPLAPKNPKMSSNTSNSVKLTWSKATGASGYYVYAYKASKGKYYKVATTTKNTATIKKLSAGTDNTYQIYSYVKIGSKTYKSTQAVNVTAGTKTKTPSIKKLTTVSSSVTATWKPVTGASGYSVYYATSKKGKYKLYGNVSGTSAYVTGLKAKRTYYFKIKAYRNIGGKNYFSSYSSIKAIKVKA